MPAQPATTPPLNPPAASIDRASLIGLSSGDPYVFLDEAFRFLQSQERDAEITVLMVRTLAHLGLGVPARELLTTQVGSLDNTEAGDLRLALRSVPSGRLAWDTLNEIYERNLEALLASRPHLEPLANTLPALRRTYQLFETTHGTRHLSQLSYGKTRRWLPALVDERQADVADLPLDHTGPVTIIAGIGLNSLIRRAYESTIARPGCRTNAIYVVDREPAHLAAWLHCADHTELLSDPRVHIFVGNDAVTQFETTLSEHDGLPLSGAHLSLGWAAQLLKEIGTAQQRVHTHRETCCQQVLDAIEERASTRTKADLAQRLQPGATILGFTSRFTTMLQYSMRDIGHAFAELGYDFKVMSEDADHAVQTTLTNGRAVLDHDPALIVLINHFRCEQLRSLGGAPMLTWVQDPTDLVLSRATGESMSAMDFACGYYADRCVETFGYPEKQFLSTVLPVSTRLFHDAPVPTEHASSFECDIMYVGHRHAAPTEMYDDWMQQVPARLQPMITRLRDRVTALINDGAHLLDPRRLVIETAQEMDVVLPDAPLQNIANFFAFRLFDALFREQTLHWVARWTTRTNRSFRLYGKGWEDDPVLRPFAQGPLEHGEPLRCAYRAARMVLLTMPSGILHQRTYEALSCGSFILARHAPASFHFIDPGSYYDTAVHEDAHRCAASTFPRLDRVTFQDEQGLGRLADHFLAHEEERTHIAAAYKQEVNDRYTYDGVVPTLVDWIRASLADDNPEHLGAAWRDRLTRPSTHAHATDA